jgi:hypothetical protein
MREKTEAIVESSQSATPFTLTSRELEILPKLPGALRELSEWHDVQATLADGMDMHGCVGFHDERKAEIRAEAERIEREMQA